MTPKNHTAGFNSFNLRQALGCFGTGITVVTPRSPAGACAGVTAKYVYQKAAPALSFRGGYGQGIALDPAPAC